MAQSPYDPEARSHWIFQANPARYDLAKELEPGATEGWLASRYATRLRIGDVVWLWQSGQRTLHGWGEIAGEAERDPADRRFWVPLIYRVRFEPPLPLEAIRSRPALAGLQILRMPQGTNFEVTPAEAAALVELAREAGLEAPEPPPEQSRGPYVPVGGSPLLGDLFRRAAIRAPMVGSVVQSLDLLAALYLEGGTATAQPDAEPASAWLHRVLAPRAGAAPTEETAPVSLLQNLSGRPEFYDEGVEEASAREAGGRLGEVLSETAAAAIERAAQIQASLELPPEEATPLPPEQRPAFDHALAAALLFGDLPAVRALLAEERLSLAALRESFLVQVAQAFGAGAVAGWRRVTRLPGVEQALANFSADRPEGEDALEIEPDVRAFASVIAARAVTPPLSIGLFGNWGSGKSFFMHRLRGQIDALTATARREGAAGAQENLESPFWPNIEQIEFNAWHYVESNLWASLVAHLFNSLARLEEKTEAAESRRQEALIRDLNLAAQLERHARDEERTARDQLAMAQWKLQQKRREVERTRVRLSLFELLRAVPWEALGERVSAELRARAEAGDPQALAEVRRKVGSELEASRSLAGRFAALLRATGRLDGRSKALLAALLLLGVGGAAALGWLLRDLDWQPLVAGGLALFATLLAWWGRVRTMADETLGLLERTRERLEQVVAGRPEARQAEALRQELADLEVELANAEVQSRQAAERVERAEAALREFRTTASVAHFIEERAGSGDYREQLGLLALIRNDFEELSRRLRRARGEAGAAALPLSDPSRIDRIVLYIDDLDRCPPERVFEVLQAIHLLLAFDLFVVVVGVDERWLSRALAMARAGLLARSGAESFKLLQSLGLEGGEAADPSDFLEKIFQIPFWLRPIDKDSFGRLVDGLVAADLPPEPTATPEPAPDGGAPESTPPTPAGGGAPAGQAAGRAVGLEDETPAEAQTIFVEPFERDCMRDLAAVVGRSPRTAKAFVNIWRVLKARESIGRSLAPLRPEESCGGLLLLALVVGHPHGTEAILEMVRTADPATPAGELFAVAASGEPHGLPDCLGRSGVSPALWRELAHIAESHLGDLEARVLQAWLPTVRRFSFNAAVAHDPDHLDLFRGRPERASAQPTLPG